MLWGYLWSRYCWTTRDHMCYKATSDQGIIELPMMTSDIKLSLWSRNCWTTPDHMCYKATSYQGIVEQPLMKSDVYKAQPLIKVLLNYPWSHLLPRYLWSRYYWTTPDDKWYKAQPLIKVPLIPSVLINPWLYSLLTVVRVHCWGMHNVHIYKPFQETWVYFRRYSDDIASRAHRLIDHTWHD